MNTCYLLYFYSLWFGWAPSAEAFFFRIDIEGREICKLRIQFFSFEHLAEIIIFSFEPAHMKRLCPVLPEIKEEKERD